MRLECDNFLTRLERINNFKLDLNNIHRYKPFLCQGVQVGLISEEVSSVLLNYPEVFYISDTGVTFNNHIQGFTQCSQALSTVLNQLQKEKAFPCLKGWRNECYEISETYGSERLFEIERCAAPLFGIRKYGVHINGYVNHEENGISLWLQRRSYSKQTYPGKIDNFVGGALTEGRSVFETAVKEGAEEAGLTEQLAAGLKPCGSISYMHQSERGIHPQTEFVFDLELPQQFVPENQDGEVQDWILCPVSNILDIITSEDFKMTSFPVALDFLIRHGFINIENERNLPKIIEMLHTPVHTLYNAIQEPLLNSQDSSF